jgi:hypothetical protein
LIVLSDDPARAIDRAPMLFGYDLLAALQPHGLLKDLQPVLHGLERPTVCRRHPIDDILLAAQDGVAAEALVERAADGGKFTPDSGV